MSDVLAKLTSRTWPWMTAATILVAGFMYWLYAASSAIETTRIAADTAAALPRVPDTAFVKDPTQYSRRRILLYPVKVEESIGRAALAVDLPGMPAYPLILERNVVEQGITVVPGDELIVAGQVYALNDSLLDVYSQRGLFDPQYRERLVGRTTFFLVDSLDFFIPETAVPMQDADGS